MPQGSYYQYIDSLPAGPTRLPTNAARVKFEFDISDGIFKRLPKIRTGGDGRYFTVFEGCLRMRFRICMRQDSGSKDRTFSELEWVSMATVWPSAVTVKVNEDGFINIPRSKGNGSQMASDITAYLRAGRNVVSVAVLSEAPFGKEFFGAVEMLNMETKNTIVGNAIQEKSLPEAKTIALVKSRLDVGDDDLQIVDPEICISITDPISSVLVGVPCRGDTCSHLDVFDLGALLESRRPKRCPHGGVRQKCALCVAGPNMWPDVGSADRWVCPICGGDARPGHVVVDRFLQGVVKKLESDAGKGGPVARAIYVDGEGRWRAKSPGKREEAEVVVVDG